METFSATVKISRAMFQIGEKGLEPIASPQTEKNLSYDRQNELLTYLSWAETFSIEIGEDGAVRINDSGKFKLPEAIFYSPTEHGSHTITIDISGVATLAANTYAYR